jgi:hypothetical protein
VRYPDGVLALLILACFLRPVTRVDAREASLTAADAHFLARSGPEGAAELARAVEGWTSLLANAPRDTGVLARLAHAHWLLAQTEPEEARTHLEIGEEFGWRCLLASPAFASAQRASGQVRGAAGTLSPNEAPCVGWLTANALDRAALRGPGAALSLEEQHALMERWRAMGGEAAPWAPVPGLQEALEARMALLRARDEASRRSALGRMEQVVERAPGVFRWRLDLARAGGDVTLPEGNGNPAFALENAAARAAWPSEAPAKR